MSAQTWNEYLEDKAHLIEKNIELYSHLTELAQAMATYHAVGNVSMLIHFLKYDEHPIHDVLECREIHHELATKTFGKRAMTRDMSETRCYLYHNLKHAPHGKLDIWIASIVNQFDIPLSYGVVRDYYFDDKTLHEQKQCPICNSQDEKVIMWQNYRDELQSRFFDFHIDAIIKNTITQDRIQMLIL